jgi:hypothetical protein
MAVRGILDTPSGVRLLTSGALQAYAKNACAWLISQHASGVRQNVRAQLIDVPSERSIPPGHFVAGPYNREPLRIGDSAHSLFAKSNRWRY